MNKVVEYKPPAKPKAATPLEFFEAVYMNPDLPLGTRLKAATEAAKYVHPRVMAVANLNANGMAFGDELETRRAARDGRLIENKPQVGSQVAPPVGKSAAEVSAEHLGKSFPMLRRRPI